ncbi:MAG: TraB domain-containing protein, partial [Myxococcota bacterium]
MSTEADNAANIGRDEEAEQDIHRFQLDDGRDVILVGTAHVSQASVETVKRTIAQEAPDVVCVELDERRYNALRNKAWWESLDLFQVIRKGQAPFLLANLFLSSYQKRMGLATGVKPGAELAAAAIAAEEAGAEVVLCDREIRTTLLRIWRTMPFMSKMGLASELLGGLLGMGEQQEISEEMLAELRKRDTLTLVLDEMGERHPTIKRTLVDERDTYMAHHIRTAKGQRIVAVVGAAHVPGILKAVHTDTSPETIEAISTIPPRSFWSKLLPWLLPNDNQGQQ